MDVFSGEIVEIISGPTKKRVERVVTITRRWVNGVEQPQKTKEHVDETWEVVAKVKNDWGGKIKKFKCSSEDEAKKLIPGFTYPY